MSIKLPKHLGTAIRFALVGGCLVYAFWGLEWDKFLGAVQQFGWFGLCVTGVLSVVQYLPVALRISYLSHWQASLLVSLKASVFCLGVNNILPAKLGEVAKAYYLRKKTGIPLGKGLGLIFWERFFDLNILLLLGLAAAFLLGKNVVVAPMAIVVGSIWAAVILFRWKPGLCELVAKFLPGQKLKDLFHEVMEQLQCRANPRFFAALGGYSLFVWAGFAVVYFAAVWMMGELDLSFAQTLTVFVVASIGFAAPSSPGGVGVFEGAFVFAMSLFKVERETALAMALVLRFMFFVPTVLAALYVMAQSGMSLKGIREVQTESEQVEKECAFDDPADEGSLHGTR
ncbi:lysylphosphatidylglycerol synthase transmembrane domain-containing protein [Megalodesulfovibrio paquesii]